ncbi:MAG: nucleotidyltransferase domain-containing protein [Pseudomonadales bacterium]
MKSKEQAIRTARAFVENRYPTASVAFLGGSWATDTAHSESDLDLVVFDESASEVSFEGVLFNGSVVEVCVLPVAEAESFFSDSARHRSAPIPAQVAGGLLILGDEAHANLLRGVAERTITKGPKPLDQAEKDELRYELSQLLVDLKYQPAEAMTALAAVAHNALSEAMIDLNAGWRAHRKARRKAVSALDSNFVRELDEALVAGCSGDPKPMISLCEDVLELLGGPKRTYPRFTL